jgi:hypothetical protein
MQKAWFTTVLILVLIALYLVPIWRFRFFPSSDGPSHIYNAQILRHLRHADEPFHDYFVPNFRPFPNWTAAFLMWLLQFVAAPLLAEKLLLTIYIVLFVLGLHYLLKVTAHRTPLLLVVGSLYFFNYLLLMGYYSYSLGVPLLLFTIGFFWKHRDALAWKHVGLLSLLLLLLYFSHPVPYLMALVALALFSVLLYRRRGRDILRIFVGCVPSVALGFYYFLAYRIVSAEKIPLQFRSLAEVVTHLVKMTFLVTMDLQRQPLLASLSGLFILGLFIMTFAKKMRIRMNVLSYAADRKDYLLLLCLVGVLISLIIPDAVAGHGSDIFTRTIFITSLLVLPWLSDDWSKLTTAVVSVCAVGLVAVNLVVLDRSFAVANKDLSDFVSCRPQAGHANTLIPLVFRRSEPSSRIPVFVHASDYYCLNNFNINLANYEADKDYFPLRFREGVERPDPYRVFDVPASLDFDRLAGYVKFIVAYGTNDEVMAKCQASYLTACQKGRTRVLRSRTWSGQEARPPQKAP